VIAQSQWVRGTRICTSCCDDSMISPEYDCNGVAAG
jgi:hypothetical protein